tara:strand:+ start:35 stop:400 length:366 start_codon:yes stop_codon:yes gene_type:complete
MKTRKLACIVTGKTLFATREYYEKKLMKVQGDVDKLRNTYVCREAKQMLKNGFTVEKIRDTLNVDDTDLLVVPQEIINNILSTGKQYVKCISNYTPISNIINVNTDPEVKEFINNITSQDI